MIYKQSLAWLSLLDFALHCRLLCSGRRAVRESYDLIRPKSRALWERIQAHMPDPSLQFSARSPLHHTTWLGDLNCSFLLAPLAPLYPGVWLTGPFPFPWENEWGISGRWAWPQAGSPMRFTIFWAPGTCYLKPLQLPNCDQILSLLLSVWLGAFS